MEEEDPVRHTILVLDALFQSFLPSIKAGKQTVMIYFNLGTVPFGRRKREKKLFSPNRTLFPHFCGVSVSPILLIRDGETTRRGLFSSIHLTKKKQA